MKIYLVRHGETVYNAKGLHQTGQTELSEQGLRQAGFVAKRFESIQVDTILASPYPRAVKTAEIINAVAKKELTVNDLLREIKRPTEIENKSWNDPNVLDIKNTLKQHRTDTDWHYSDEENEFDVMKRCGKFLEELEKRQEKNILIVTHEVIIKMLVSVMVFEKELTLQMYHHIYSTFHHANTGITVCEKINDKWHLITWNDQAHLG